MTIKDKLLNGMLVQQANDLHTALLAAFPDSEEGVLQTTADPGFIDCCEMQPVVFWMAGATPNFQRTGGNCPAMNVSWRVRLARCIELEDDGSITSDTWLGASALSLIDLEAIMCAINASQDESFNVTSGNVYGPEGGCVTVEVNVTSYFELC